MTSDFNANKEHVADMVCGTDVGSKTVPIYMQRKSFVELDNIDAMIDSNSVTINDENDDLEDLKPGQSISFTVNIDNKYDADDDLSLEVEGEIVCDSEIEIDEETDDTEVDADDTDSIQLEITLDEDEVEDGTYDCTISFTATDDFGAVDGEKWAISLKVDKEKYEISIKEFSLNPQSLTCGGSRDVSGSIQVKNTGSKDDDEVKVEIKSDALGLNKVFEDLDLEETDTTRKTFSFTVPESVKQGSYAVIARTYNLGSSLSMQETLMLTVSDCAPATPTTPTTPVITPTTPTNPYEDVEDVEEDEEDVEEDDVEVTEDEEDVEEDSGNNVLYVVLLVLVILVLLGGIIGLLVYLFRG